MGPRGSAYRERRYATSPVALSMSAPKMMPNSASPVVPLCPPSSPPVPVFGRRAAAGAGAAAPGRCATGAAGLAACVTGLATCAAGAAGRWAVADGAGEGDGRGGGGGVVTGDGGGGGVDGRAVGAGVAATAVRLTCTAVPS